MSIEEADIKVGGSTSREAVALDSLKLKMEQLEETQTRIVKTRILQGHGDEAIPLRLNRISSTKYTLLSWLPITLGVQFRRLANIYFLMVSTLMLIGTYAPYVFRSPLEPMSTISTLVMVLLITSCKEGYDDLQRWEADNIENRIPITVMTWVEDGDGDWKMKEIIKSQQDICPGDIVKLSGKCRVPCDMVLLHSSNFDKGNTCYVETSNIDGETSLKLKSVPAAVTSSLPYLLKKVPVQGQTSKKLQTVMETTPKLFDGDLEIEKPNNLIYSFVGALHLSESACVPALENIPLGAENLLLRSSVFCNTDWCYGICVFAGKETKIQMNNRLAPLKTSNLEKYANRAIICVFTAQCILVTIAVVGFFAMGYDEFRDKLPYVYPAQASLVLEENVIVTTSDYLPLWLEQWIIFLILFNNFIPISLYVTMELVNFGQADLAANDEDMYDEELDQRCVVKTGNLLQELGQISHIFSDKTGTLTKNEMKLKFFTVDNVDVNVDDGMGGISPDLTENLNGAEHLYEFCRCLILCHTVVREQETEEELVEVDENIAIGLLQSGLSAMRRRLTSFEGLSSGFADAVQGLRRRLGSNDSAGGDSNASNNNSRKNSAGDLGALASTPAAGTGRSRGSAISDADVIARLEDRSGTRTPSPVNFPESPISSSAPGSGGSGRKNRDGSPRAGVIGVISPESIREEEIDGDDAGDDDECRVRTALFSHAKLKINLPSGADDFIASAEHWNALPPPPKEERGYRAESPDELALVLGTKGFNCHFIERVHNSVEVDIMGQGRVKYEQLAVNAFNSHRKRMSVLLCNHITNEYILLCKGADVNMLPLLNINALQRARTEDQLYQYAVTGLRTLVIAQKKISEEDALTWLAQYREAGSSMSGRSRLLDKCAESIEQNMELLGVTAIEDKLQDDVPAVISDLSRAGVTMWMLTGDKEETAANIGMSCNLTLPSTELHSLTNITSANEFKKRLNDVYRAIDPLKKKDLPIRRKDHSKPSNGNDSETVSLSTDTATSTNAAETAASDALFSSVRAGDIELSGLPTTRPANEIDSSRVSIESNEDFIVDIEAPNEESKVGGLYSPIADEESDYISSPSMSSRNEPVQHALVIDGPSFAHYDGTIESRIKFLGIGSSCRSVIACRLTPLQKAQLVAIVKKGTTDSNVSLEEGGQHGVLTLSIGDGANDVPMIQEADVGIGIFGKEGNQAANQADFAIGQFKFLRRLLLVHGRSDYLAQCDVCMYCLHKNMVLTLSLFWYSYYTSMSGTSLYESWIYSAFNLALGLPIIFYGILDKDLTQEFVLANPEVYETSRTNSRLSLFQMGGWFLNGLFYAMIICNLCYIAFTEVFEYQALYIMGTTVWTGLVMALQGKVAFMTHHWSWPQAWCMAFSIGAMFPYFVFASYGTYAFYKQAVYLFMQWDFWLLGMFTVPVVCVVLVDLLWDTFRKLFWPSNEMLYKEIQNHDIVSGKLCTQLAGVFQTNLRAKNAEVDYSTEEPTDMDRLANFSAKVASMGSIGSMGSMGNMGSMASLNVVSSMPNLELAMPPSSASFNNNPNVITTPRLATSPSWQSLKCSEKVGTAGAGDLDKLNTSEFAFVGDRANDGSKSLRQRSKNQKSEN